MKDEVLEIIDKNAVACVAFDIFDTLLSRKVDPEYVKKIWAKKLCCKLDLKYTGKELYSYRSVIESELCKKNSKKEFDLEFRYMDLISELFQKIHPSIDFDEFSKICENTEIETEFQVQDVIPESKELLIELQKREIPCICISDFYLPSDTIKKILHHHELDSYFKDIFISCDFLYSKRSGRLYDYVLKSMNIPASKVLMIGDNKSSDADLPEKKGMQTFWFDQTEIHKKYKLLRNQENDYRRIDKTINSLKKNSKDSYFENITFSLYAFIQLLHEKLVADHCKNVFFLSREGEFLKKLFDIYQEKNNFYGTEHIHSHYLIVSRKSTFLPSLNPLAEEKFDVLFRQYRKISLYEFLSSLNFDSDIIRKITENLKCDADEKQEDFLTSRLFTDLKNNAIFQNEYEERRQEQKENFICYLNQFGVDYSSEGLSMIDVGWKGSIQDNIYNIYDGKIIMKGYYLGLVALGNASERNRKIGVLFHGIGNDISANFPIYNANRTIFEMLLAATHGSANGYYPKEGKIVAETFYEPKEIELYQNVIKEIQNNIYGIFSTLCESFALSDISYFDYMQSVTQIHAKMILYPTKKEISFFRKMYHYENFGAFGYTTFQKERIDLPKRVRNFIKFIMNPREILDVGFWAPLTLEDNGLNFLKRPYAMYKMRKYKKMVNGAEK